ncbi:multiple PDZ domain protein [Clonorchis sinensis]|uniref:Multiple PDZ domain protein n=1 Tax=Clonorchis sinensis TaxID=79923 RepID=H2KTS7_CLOSI|nr:multiple PDZ domain protein [Clonorchis sinensis]
MASEAADPGKNRRKAKMTFLSGSNKRKTKQGEEDGKRGSIGSQGTIRPAQNIEVPSELSYESVATKDGGSLIFLRVYCERVRRGDHFKTVRVYNSTTAEKCIRDLIETYYIKFGDPSMYQLYEVMGSISQAVGVKTDTGDGLLFQEVKVRKIEPHETVQEIFSTIHPGTGLTRRIELRVGGSKTGGSRYSVGSSQDNLPRITDEPSLRRSLTPGSARLTFRDSRTKRKSNVEHSPGGPYLLLLRGTDPSNDVLFHDLGSLIYGENHSNEKTVGFHPSADIRLFCAPNITCSPERLQIIAKLVGEDIPLTVDGPSILSGAVYLESASSNKNNGSSPLLTPISINNEILTGPDDFQFERRMLHPGDFIYFGSSKQGYVFLFKDPRWIPDYRLELALTSTVYDAGAETPQRCGTLGSLYRGRNSDRSSDTDSSLSASLRQRALLSSQVPEQIPRAASLRQVIIDLFTHPLPGCSQNTRQAMDPFDLPPWSKLEPWRSACLFSHILRFTAQFVVKINCPIPNKDVEETHHKTIREYAINRMKDMRSLLLECHQNVSNAANDLIYPHVWLGLFCYDLAVLLSPGWLGATSFPDDRIPVRGRPDTRSETNEPNMPRLFRLVESLPVMVDLRDLAYRLADDSLMVVVKTVFEELAPLTAPFFQDTAFSAASGRPRIVEDQHPELRVRLNKLASCLANTLNLCGDTLDEHPASTGSSPFHTSSTDDSFQSAKQPNHNRSRNFDHSFPDSSDRSISGDTDSESGDQGGTSRRLLVSRAKRQSAVLKGRPESKGTGTAQRVEAIIWRQLLASLSHNALYEILGTPSIKIDEHTGRLLLSGFEWLQTWLKDNGLEIHRRPLSMIMEFAKLMSTHHEDLLHMTWTNMRSSFPSVPPALIKFMLDEYMVKDEHITNPIWQVDAHDDTAANEDPPDVIGQILQGWRSKESAQYQNQHQRYGPTYRPRDPWTVFKMPETEELLKRLDQRLEAQKIGFRWTELLKQFSPLQAIQGAPEPESIMINRPESRQRRLIVKRNPSQHATSSSTTTEDEAHHRKTPTADILLMSPRNRRTTDSELMKVKPPLEPNLPTLNKPAQSKGEPTRVSRGRGANQTRTSLDAVLQDIPADAREDAVYHLNQLLSSLSKSDMKKIMQTNGRLESAVDRAKSSARGTRKRNKLYESQPNMNSLFEQGDEEPLAGNGQLPASIAARSPVFTQSTRFFNPASSTNKLAKSMLQLPLGENEESHLNAPEPNELLLVSKDYEQFRMSTIGKGMSKLRDPLQQFGLNNPLRPQVSGSLGNLSAPQIWIQGSRDASSISGAESISDRLQHGLYRDDDLVNIASRVQQGYTVVNVTLTRTADSGFGLVLVDGERTSLDQPGVFVKSTTANSAASEKGEIKFGDQILAINGQDLTQKTYSEALKLLKDCKMQATFTIRRCNLDDPSLLLVPKINPLPTGRH